MLKTRSSSKKALQHRSARSNNPTTHPKRSRHQHTSSVSRIYTSTHRKFASKNSNTIDRSGLTQLKNIKPTLETLQQQHEIELRGTPMDAFRKQLDEQSKERRAQREAEKKARGPNIFEKKLQQHGLLDKFYQHDKVATQFISEKIGGDDLKHMRQMNETTLLTPPPEYLDRHTSSPYFCPIWSPELRTPELSASFEKSTGLHIDTMDLIGKDLHNNDVNLRQRIIQPNKITLVQLVSTQRPFEIASLLSSVWLDTFNDHGFSNQNGALVMDNILINVTEGFFAGLFTSRFNSTLQEQLLPELQQGYVHFHIKKDTDPIARTRRALDCRNRFVDNIFLVDERGLIRWRSSTSHMPSPDFAETLMSVTEDLLLETKYGEARH